MHECAISRTVLAVEVQISLSWQAASNPVFFFYSLWQWDVFCTVVELEVSVWKNTKDAVFTFVLITFQFEMYVSCLKAVKKCYTRVHTKQFRYAPLQSPVSALAVSELWGSVSDLIWVTADTEVKVDSLAPFHVLCKEHALYRHTWYFTHCIGCPLSFKLLVLGCW